MRRSERLQRVIDDPQGPDGVVGIVAEDQVAARGDVHVDVGGDEVGDGGAGVEGDESLQLGVGGVDRRGDSCGGGVVTLGIGGEGGITVVIDGPGGRRPVGDDQILLGGRVMGLLRLAEERGRGDGDQDGDDQDDDQQLYERETARGAEPAQMRVPQMTLVHIPTFRSPESAHDVFRLPQRCRDPSLPEASVSGWGESPGSSPSAPGRPACTTRSGGLGRFSTSGGRDRLSGSAPASQP